MAPCSSCDQMKKENKALRTAITEIERNYVEVINENLELRRDLIKLQKKIYGDRF